MFESTGLLLGWIACTWIVANIFIGMYEALKESSDKLHDQLVKRLDEIVHRVEIVEDKSVFYWYDRDNHKFLAQGRTTEEIITHIKARFPDHIFYFEESNHLICAKHGWEPQPTQLTNKSQ